jgi:capsular polysaccharide transport system permease protein
VSKTAKEPPQDGTAATPEAAHSAAAPVALSERRARRAAERASEKAGERTGERRAARAQGAEGEAGEDTADRTARARRAARPGADAAGQEPPAALVVPVGAARPATRPGSQAAVPSAAASAPAAPATSSTPPSAADPVAAPAAPAQRVLPVARPARMRRRHWLALLSFLLCVGGPTGITAWYLWTHAADQYASTVGFSVRREEGGSALELLGGITALSGSSSSDTDILYEFLHSQKLVADMDAALDLRSIWSLPGQSWQDGDPWFSFAPEGTIEDLVAYWKRMVQISYDSGSGLIEVRVLAFRAEDATRIAQAILDRSSVTINELNAIAREDGIRHAREELDVSVERLRTARAAVTQFRNEHQLVDPTIDLQTQAGLIGTLQGQLAEALIDVDLLRDTTSENDPRLVQALRRVEVIEERIAEERAKMGVGSGAEEGNAFAEIVGDYERLQVDREFAQQAYVASLAAYDGAQAEARRQSRYLAAHILPTTAESARFPDRTLLTGMVGLFSFLAWAILLLMVYSFRDRR